MCNRCAVYVSAAGIALVDVFVRGKPLLSCKSSELSVSLGPVTWTSRQWVKAVIFTAKASVKIITTSTRIPQSRPL